MIVLHLKRFMLFVGFWLVLTSGRLTDLAPGLLAAAAATWLAHRLARVEDRPLRLLPLLPLFPGFLWRSFAGGVDVAHRALSPRMPLRPGWIRFRTCLPEGPGRVALSGQISLMPGTLAAGSDGNDILVHCLDVRKDVRAEVAAEEQRLLPALSPGGDPGAAKVR